MSTEYGSVDTSAGATGTRLLKKAYSDHCTELDYGVHRSNSSTATRPAVLQHVQMGWSSKRPAGLSWPCGNAPRSAFELRSNAPWSNPSITASSTARHHFVIDFTSPRACGPSCSLEKRVVSKQPSFCKRNSTSSIRPELPLPTSTLSPSRTNPCSFCFFRLSAAPLPPRPRPAV